MLIYQRVYIKHTTGSIPIFSVAFPGFTAMTFPAKQLHVEEISQLAMFDYRFRYIRI